MFTSSRFIHRSLPIKLAAIFAPISLTPCASSEVDQSESPTQQQIVATSQGDRPEIPANPLIDYQGFREAVHKAGQFRGPKRLSETDFYAAMQEENVILLDARSAHRYAQRHITGAINLPFTDFTAKSLAEIIPDKSTKIIIYCNNNFLGDSIALASKSPSASLNLHTQADLHTYGYDNVYELASLVHVKNTILPMQGSHIEGHQNQKEAATSDPQAEPKHQ
jgi:hypothetical protein